jgi:aerobic carbon-monoxide dehydrogenase medium subunit
MYPPQFDYVAPSSLEEAVALLAEHGEEARVLSGGQSLLPAMKVGLSYPELLVDLGRIPSLRGLEDGDEGLRILGMTTHAACERSGEVQGRYPTLGQAARVIADPLVRNRGTVGGSLAHADPSGDLGAVMLALRAIFVATGPGGNRDVPAREFFTGPFMTALEPGEILTEVRVPAPAAASGGAYLKLERKVGDFATAAVAVAVTLEGGAVAEVGIGLTAVGPNNLAATAAEDALRGQEPTEDLIAEAGRLAAAGCEPQADLRGSADYKRAVIEAFTVRGLRQAVEQARNALVPA